MSTYFEGIALLLLVLHVFDYQPTLLRPNARIFVFSFHFVALIAFLMIYGIHTNMSCILNYCTLIKSYFLHIL